MGGDVKTEEGEQHKRGTEREENSLCIIIMYCIDHAILIAFGTTNQNGRKRSRTEGRNT